jgi:[1-hydroxy-2-(trimethylamino)ethyl]phosphonate dioxygenase
MMRDMKDRVPDEVRALFAARGHETYSERVTMAEHARQAAALAHVAGADDALVLAALLHDVGHFLDEPDSAFGVTDHGTTGGAWVAERFADGVSEPVRLHVAAKRYRCFVDPGYEAELSPASVGTLRLQGGPMSAVEAAAFESEPFAAAALAVRGWDDAGKIDGDRVDGLEIPPVEHWEYLLVAPGLRR